jgi:hypothetical protein
MLAGLAFGRSRRIVDAASVAARDAAGAAAGGSDECANRADTCADGSGYASDWRGVDGRANGRIADCVNDGCDSGVGSDTREQHV